MNQPTDSGTQEPGTVSHGTPTTSMAGPEQQALHVLIGRWINVGETVATNEAPAVPIVASDVYEWAPGGFFVLHYAYGRIGELGVGGIEVIGYDVERKAYRCHFFDSEGNTTTQEMTLGDDAVTWEGDGARCDATFSDRGRALTAHHKRMDEHGGWVPSMETTLRRVD